MDAVEDFIATA
ncbi:hypothetical protein GQ600_15225 [Phytophthora cactorum]|nr:hypothetical protein GQ600_15225 [Phytophthora cactorum]